MTIFDQIKSILTTKNRIEINLDNESEFSLYMIDRWISMYSPELATVINQTTNNWWNIFSTKQEQYDFLFYLLPAYRFKRIQYIKKTKKDKKGTKEQEIENILKIIANNKQISFREAKEMYELQKDIGS